MPAALQYLTDTGSQEYKALEQAHATEVRDRAKVFKLHWQYYDGIMPEPLKKEKDKVNDNVLLGKVDQVADKIVSFLLGDGVRFDVGADDKQDEQDNDVALLWQQNRGAMLQHNIALSGALTGHCWVRLEPREKLFPRIVHLNAEHCSSFWQIDDIDRVLWYRLQYRLGEGGSGKRIDYVRGAWDGRNVDYAADGWLEFVYRSEAGVLGGEWKMQSEPRPLEWDFPPVIDWQNMPRPHSYYGMDDVHRAVALNNTINFVASNYNRILKHHGHPRTIGTGMDAADLIASEIGGFWTVNRPDAKIYNLEMQSDLSSAREFLNIILCEVWQSAGLTDPQTVKDKVGALTNFGLRVLFSDALHRTESKRQLYSEGFEQIGQRALVIAGKQLPERITTVWPNVLPTDESEAIKVGLEELAAGVLDKRSYTEERGRDWEKIEQRLDEEKAGEDNIGARLLSAFERGA